MSDRYYSGFGYGTGKGYGDGYGIGAGSGEGYGTGSGSGSRYGDGYSSTAGTGHIDLSTDTRPFAEIARDYEQ